MITKTYRFEAGDEAPMHPMAVNSSEKLCTECGKKLGSNPFYFEVNTSWQLIKPDSDSQNSQGCFPVGQTCAFKFDPELLTKIGA
jgi:hypothetical protein